MDLSTDDIDWLREVIADAFHWGMAYEGCGSDQPEEEAIEEILKEWIDR